MAERLFRIKLTDVDGVARDFQFNAGQLNDLIHALIEAARQPADAERVLQVDTRLRDNPIRATFFGIAPSPGQPSDARVIARAGPLELQVLVPLDDLFEALKALEENTSRGPSAPGH